MGPTRLGIIAIAALVVLATTACEPTPSPWDVELVSARAAGALVASATYEADADDNIVALTSN
jgi:hypothetical protein